MRLAGYVKKEGQISTLKRTVTPQLIAVELLLKNGCLIFTT